MPFTELGTARLEQVGGIQGSVLGRGCWSRQPGTGPGLKMDVGQLSSLMTLKPRGKGVCELSKLSGDRLSWPQIQGHLLRVRSPARFLLGDTLRMALETDPYYFRRQVEAQQGRVTCARSHSWLRLSQSSCSGLRPLPCLLVHQGSLGRPNAHPNEDIAHSEDLG